MNKVSLLHLIFAVYVLLSGMLVVTSCTIDWRFDRIEKALKLEVGK
jgi:hypothetical protein